MYDYARTDYANVCPGGHSCAARPDSPENNHRLHKYFDNLHFHRRRISDTAADLGKKCGQ
jgi:hypothetical protein